MKKFLAVLFSVVILATFMAVPTFAEQSPEGEVIFTVEMPDGERLAINGGDSITLKASDNEKEFDCWVITGNYEIVSGTVNSKEFVIVPKSDLTVEEKYKDTVVEDEDKDENESDKAPQTGNGVLMVTVLLTAVAFVGVVATKKAVRA